MYSPTVVGRREMVTVEGIGPIVGKFDTGNMVVNSIHADKYEIDGDVVKWTNNCKRFTNKVIDTITVLQGAIAHNEEKRPMIELDIEFMGKKYPKRRFTIDDRSQKGTPLLMGVPFMKDFGLIEDPGKTFIKTQSLEEEALTKKEMKLPKSDEDIEKWAKEYPDVAAIVETIAMKKAKEQSVALEERLKAIDDMQISATKEKAEVELMRLHPDFDEIRDSDDFHEWAEEQPKWVQEALYENDNDARSAARAID